MLAVASSDAINLLCYLWEIITTFFSLLHLQAVEWLKANIKASGQACDVLPQHDSHFNNSLELAVRFGKVKQPSSLVR